MLGWVSIQQPFVQKLWGTGCKSVNPSSIAINALAQALILEQIFWGLTIVFQNLLFIIETH